MTFTEENSLLTNNLLDRTFFAAWKPENKDNPKYQNYSALEFIINGVCDLRCKYCYITRFRDQIYPKAEPEVILKNISMMLTWLKENKLQPPRLEIFSGDPLMQLVGLQALDMIVDFASEYKPYIIIPTNMNFLMHENMFERYIKIYEKAKSIGVPIYLSASIDGKYCDANRPHAGIGIPRDYDKIFKFAKKYNISFHPMVYSEEIDSWKDNFLWFQEMFEKHNIDWKALYLLEVRNKEWNTNQLKSFSNFIYFIHTWIRNKLSNLSPEEYIRYVFSNTLFNLFSIFSVIGRGVGCSIQSSFQLRTQDLAVYPCHRLTYKQLKMFQFHVENDRITGIEGINPELQIAVQATSSKILPYCEQCGIRLLCTGQCLGSMFENTGDMFTPVPEVCALEHAKTYATIKAMYDMKIFPKALHLLHIDKINSIELLEKENIWK